MHYYLLISPSEALVASMLPSDEFGMYMAMGEHKTASEELIFIELTGEFTSEFDWDYARRACKPHADGTPKNSVYLSVYRVLERVPLRYMGNMYLVTKDGRCLEITQGLYAPPPQWNGRALYKELCPVTPLVASSLPPEPFSRYLLDTTNHIAVPAIVFADMNLAVSSSDSSKLSLQELEHVKMCLAELRDQPGKRSKTIDCSANISFTYNRIGQGFFIARHHEGFLFYPMPHHDAIKEEHFEWGRSADFF